MDCIIRKALKEDVAAMHRLVRELAAFEKAPEAVTNTVEDMLKDGFGQQPVYFAFVAELQNEIVGMAISYIKYSTWKGKGVFLEDIVVTEKMRGRGIGKKLFDAVLNEAKKMKASTMHWQVLDWNTGAISFYKKYGCTFENEWIDCKLTADQIASSGL